MADNVNVVSEATTVLFKVAMDEVTYSGDTAKVQLIRPVGVTGAEGSKTVTEILGTAGSPGTAVLTIQGVGSGTAVPVSVASVPSHAVTNAGTFATQVDGAALTALQLIDNLPNTIGSTTSGQSGALGMGGTTLAEVTADVRRQLAAASAVEGTNDVLAAIAIGTSIPVTAPAAAAATALQIWQAKAQRLVRLQALVDAGLNNATATSDIATLKADLNATYQAGFAGQF